MRTSSFPSVLAAALALAFSFGCGGGKDGDGDQGGKGPKVQDGGGKGGLPEGWPPEEEEEDPKGKSSVTKGELRRLTEAMSSLKDCLFLNDPDGFREGFIDVDGLRSAVTRQKGAEAWKKLVLETGGDEVEFRKHYAAGILSLYENLRKPGDRCELAEQEISKIRKAGEAPRLYLADTFHSPLGRNMVIVLAGFPDSESVKGLFRMRAMPHQNQLKWHLSGDERIESLGRVRASEREGLKALLLAVAAEQKAFTEKRTLDRDGDGTAEFGTLGELGGAEPLRGTEKDLYQGSLPLELREVSVNGAALTRGYMVRVLLPGATEGAYRDRVGIPEPPEVTDAREKTWCAAAWPVCAELGESLYFTGPSGRVLRSKEKSPYFGIENAPPPGLGFEGSGPEAARCQGTPLSKAGKDGTGTEWVEIE